MELGHADLIRVSSLMQWNMEVQHTSNYSLGMGLQEYIGIRSFRAVSDMSKVSNLCMLYAVTVSCMLPGMLYDVILSLNVKLELASI